MTRRAVNSRSKSNPRKAATPAKRDTAQEVTYALQWMEHRGTRRNRDGLARYGITAKKVFGISVVQMRSLAKKRPAKSAG